MSGPGILGAFVVGSLSGVAATIAATRLARTKRFRRLARPHLLGHEPLLRLELLSWNVLQSSNVNGWGAPWADRQKAFTHLLGDHRADIVCLQEVLPPDLDFFAETLPGHDWIGAGRNDGDADGEHCPIYWRRDRFESTRGGVFWLSPTPDVPGKAWGETVPRICTWTELRERVSGRSLRVYNAHFPLHPNAQPRAARVITNRARHDRVPSILCGDLNCSPRWPAIRVFEREGFQRAEQSGAMTFHLKGKGLRCLDHILVDHCWRVVGGDLLDEHLDGVHPSDHFGLLAEVEMVLDE